jgi:hypothetical protein
MVSSKRVLRWTISLVAWANEELELQRHDRGFECRDGKELLIYGTHTSLLAYYWLQSFYFFIFVFVFQILWCNQSGEHSQKQ